jgi:uncharacterized protein YndB with AHSA1/START domain
MPATTRDVVHTYHQAWTAGRYDEAIAVLSPRLSVEVPINRYPTRASFAAALRKFSRQVSAVNVISEMVSDPEAMLLYDLEVKGLGGLRVVEHFTVSGGKIVRLRQIHDTAALRNDVFDQEISPGPGSDGPDYRASVEIAVPPDRVFQSLTTLEGIAGWWTSRVAGSAHKSGKIELDFAGLDERIIMHVDAAIPNSSVLWTCTKHTGHPEWEETRIAFAITGHDSTGSTLTVHHKGLVPQLRCYDQCEAGWNHFLHSIRLYLEQGKGRSFDDRLGPAGP